MRNYGLVVAVFVVFTLNAWPAGAQEARAVEVTPYVAVGTAGAFPLGAAVTFPLTSTLSIETDVSHRRAEGGIHALSSSTSLLFALPRLGPATPYLAAGVGVSQYGAPIFSSSRQPIGTEQRVALTMNAGGGLKMPMNEALDLRTG